MQLSMSSTDQQKESQTTMNASPTNPRSSNASPNQFREDGDTTPARNNSGTQEQDSENDDDSRPSAPMQKRRRVTRACDECRRKKIKCDGKQPCTHCTVYSYDCTYDQPSNRRRNPAPQYIEALEQRLQKAESILRSVLPGIDIDDPKYDARGIDQIIETTRNTQQRRPNPVQQAEDDAHMRSMVDGTGSLDLDDSGYYDYHGHSSGYNFMRRFRAQFGEEFLPQPRPIENRNLANVHESPKSLYSSPFEAGISLNNDLPPKHVAIDLCRNAIDDCCALQRPLHRPTFFRRLDAVYGTEPENYTNEHIKFLPLLYTAMSVGCLFGADDKNELNKKGYRAAMEQGYQYFNVAKTMLDVTDCRDLISIQAVMFMILFLQGTAKLATCYSYVGVALRTCCRLGMHRKLEGKFSVIEQEERKRIFWLVRKMDIYVGAMLGLPQMLSNDDIDQELPAEVSDESITENGIVPANQQSFSLMKATNAHTKLLIILQKVVRYVYPAKPRDDGANAGDPAMISHSLIRELERDLQNWMDELPMELRPSDNVDNDLSRVQQLLRMSYAYVQMMIYRPFLHYVSQACQTARTDKRSFACAAACVSVARNIVHITSEMKRRGLLMGSYWFVMYTTYFAILSLLYFVLENPESNTSKDILKDAVEGRDTLANLATRSLAADRCTMSLTSLFEALPEKLNERRSSLRAMPNTSKKRPPPVSEPLFFGNPAENVQSQTPIATPDTKFAAPARTRTLPQEYIAKAANKRMSVPNPHSSVNPAYHMTPETAFSTIATPTESSGFGSSHTGTPTAPNNLDFGTPAMVQGQLPDLKSVMFPGDNPFAYPNQPMSTLATMPSTPFGNDSPSAINMYDPSLGTNQQPFTQDFDKFSSQQGLRGDQNYNQNRNQNQQQPQMPSQFFNTSNISSEPNMISMPQQHNSLQVPGTIEQDDYWSHAPAKGNFRTGLTPGGPGINLNLDDIFGNGQGWSMPMEINMGTNGQDQGMNEWPGQGQEWQ